jgi:hypothetical protein
MANIIKERMAADIEGDFVVFLIGMRINKFWKVQKWLPVFRAMPKMLKELSANPELGLLGFNLHLGIRNQLVVQYWRSFDHLDAYARNQDAAHLPAWVDFNRKTGSNGDVGIWHETFVVKAGEYEAIYNNMPQYGLGQAGKLVTASGRRLTATGRMGKTQGEDAPVDVRGNVLVAVDSPGREE